ncbi:MAG: shikimate kinase [Chitinophagaceae bacterium]
MLIFLIGFMGSGKSFCGKKIAAALNYPFFDLDQEIEAAQKQQVSEIFSQKGEMGFRQIEAEQLRKLINNFSSADPQHNAVIACGGGTPCFHDNMQFMNQHGLTVWISPSLDTLTNRLKLEKDHRPLIANLNDAALKTYIAEKISEREVFYRQAQIIDASGDCPLHTIEKKLYNAQ